MVPLLTHTGGGGALGFPHTKKFMMSQLPQQVYNIITKYNIVIGLIAVAESDDSCL